MAGEDLMRSARFRAEREADWRRLEVLVADAERHGVRNMSFRSARDLAALYRQSTVSLSIAREISLDKGLLDYLEALTARAYLSVYAPQETVGGLVSRFFRVSGPRAMRDAWAYIGIGFLTMALGAIVGYLLYVEDPAWFYVFMPGELAGTRTPNASASELRNHIYDSSPQASGLANFAAYLFSHNTRIAIFAFGLGVFLCAPAILLTFYNGLMLGAFYALHVDRGLGWDLFGWLSVHGVTELSAICIACAGGVMLGSAILFPGEKRRSEALYETGRTAVKLALISALMLLVAAVLEAYPRQLVQDLNMRITIGWGIGALWLAWFAFAGARRK